MEKGTERMEDTCSVHQALTLSLPVVCAVLWHSFLVPHNWKRMTSGASAVALYWGVLGTFDTIGVQPVQANGLHRHRSMDWGKNSSLLYGSATTVWDVAFVSRALTALLGQL